MAHRKQGYRFENDWDYERLKEGAEKRWKSAITIPVNLEIKGKQRVLNLEKVKEYLSKARVICIADCVCRPARKNCDAPVNVCIRINKMGERFLREESLKYTHPREASFDEAMEVLEQTHEAGLIHMAYTIGEDLEPSDINAICSCCTCCCGILSGILRFGLAPHLLTGSMVSVTDESSCTGCGMCEERCQFGARKMVDGSLEFNPDLCFGCGLCASTCPTNAITLIDKH